MCLPMSYDLVFQFVKNKPMKRTISGFAVSGEEPPSKEATLIFFPGPIASSFMNIISTQLQVIAHFMENQTKKIIRLISASIEFCSVSLIPLYPLWTIKYRLLSYRVAFFPLISTLFFSSIWKWAAGACLYGLDRFPHRTASGRNGFLQSIQFLSSKDAPNFNDQSTKKTQVRDHLPQHFA